MAGRKDPRKRPIIGVSINPLNTETSETCGNRSRDNERIKIKN